MENIASSAAATAWSAAAVFVVVAALGIIVGANQLRDLALRLVGAAVVVGIAIRSLGSAIVDNDAPSAGGPGSGDAWLCVAFAVGHLVLALVLVARWLRPRAGAERAEERRRARTRERQRVAPRDVELDP